MPRHALPTRTLRDRPDLDQLKRQARELLDAFRAGDARAAKEVLACYGRADTGAFGLHDAQLVLARAYGFDSWPRLKAFVNGATVRRLIEAVRAGDLDAVASMVDARPELVHVDAAENDEHRALHHAVLQRHADVVRLLMRHGADARKGIWPHRGATSAFTLASERGYDEIVRIIEEEEAGRSASPHASQQPERVAGPVSQAVASNRPDVLKRLLEQGHDPDEAGRVQGLEEIVPTWGEPLRACAMSGQIELAEILLAHGANPNTNVYAASSAMYEAFKRRNAPMIALLERYGGRLTAIAVADLGLVDRAGRLLAEAAAGRTPDGVVAPGSSVVQDLLWGAIESPSPEIVRMALEATSWPRDDPRWHGILENGLYLRPDSDRPRHLDAFRLVLDRCDPNISSGRGTTLLHEIAASRGGLTGDDRLAYAMLLLDRGMRVDVRDNLLQSTPLGWACRWGRTEMAKLLLDRGADPVEADAEPWATPAAWAKKRGDPELVALLDVTNGRRARRGP